MKQRERQMFRHHKGIAIGLIAVAMALVTASCAASTEPETPPDSGNAAAIGQPIPGGGLTVGEALAYTGSQVIAVKAFLIQDATEARLCDLVLESLPPQCGEPSMRITNPEAFPQETVVSQQGIKWTDQPVTIFGHINNGDFTIATNVNG